MTYGEANIAKARRKDNRPKLLGLALAAALLTAASAAADFAYAIPVSIAWQVPLRSDERYALEVSKDAFFAEIVLVTEVRGTGFSWELEDEGVYHWRLLRPGRTYEQVAGAEGSTFVSGSFVALDASEREAPARISWPRIEGADRYKLYVSDGGMRLRTMVTEALFFVVEDSREPMMIEVVPFTGGRRTFRFFQYWPELAFDAGKGEAAAPPPPPLLAEPGPNQPPGPVEPAVEGVVETPAAPGPPAKPAVPMSPLGRRVYLLAPQVYRGDETMTLTKLDVKVESKVPVNGASAVIFTEPMAGLVVTAEGSYHEHEDELTRPDLGVPAGKKLKIDQSRYHLALGVGWDFMETFGVENQLLSLSIMAAGTQLPLLPLIYGSVAGDPPVPPKLEKRQVSLLGGGMAYGYFGEAAGFMLDGGYLVETSDEAILGYGRATLELYPTDTLVVQLGVLQRQTEASRCAGDQTICLREGRVHTNIKEISGFLGIGAAFR